MSDGCDGGGGDGGEGTGYDGAAGELNGGEGQYLLIGAAPQGFLTSGVDPGLTYVKETFGHAQAYGHQDVKKAVPKGTSLTALMANEVALQSARQIGGVNELAEYREGYLWQHPSFQGLAAPGATEPQGRLFNLPGIARNQTTVEVLAWPHAECKPAHAVRQFMANAGLSRLELRQSSQLAEIDKREFTVLSNRPFGDPKNLINRPNGWFQGAEGDTWLWREFYQVKEAARFSWPWSPPADKDCYGTFLCVFGATYKYHLTGDFETRVAFTVWSVPYNAKGQWTYKWNQIKTHRDVAERAAESMSWYFKRFPALTAGINQRKRMPLEDTEPVLAPPVANKPPVELPPPALDCKIPDRTPGPEGDEVSDPLSGELSDPLADEATK